MGNAQTVKSKYHRTTLIYCGKWYNSNEQYEHNCSCEPYKKCKPVFKYTMHIVNLKTGKEKIYRLVTTLKNRFVTLGKSGDYKVFLSTVSWKETHVVVPTGDCHDRPEIALIDIY